MSFRFINPESFGAPRGYSNGVLTDGGRLLFIFNNEDLHEGSCSSNEPRRVALRESGKRRIGLQPVLFC